jgi:hypothetical protein
VRLEIDRELFSSVMRGRKSIPFGSNQLNDFAGLPWGSLVVVECEGGATKGYVLGGPARFAATRDGGFWYVPVIEAPEPGASKESVLAHAACWRKTHGLDQRESL